jgi:spore maturation protein CgeB
MKRILLISDTSYKPDKIFMDQIPKLGKGFLRNGNDVRYFFYNSIISQLSWTRSKKYSGILYKNKADEILSDYARAYSPDIVLLGFCHHLDFNTVRRLREAVKNAIIIGGDGDPWPKLQKNRIETAKELDILTATNDGQWLQDYRDVGVPLCVFMPNMCDPDIDYRYEVEEKWKTDILWIGKLQHQADTSEDFREKLIKKLTVRPNCSFYGCCGNPPIGGRECLYAISGARIGLNVNAYGPVKFAHSDRITRFMAGGTLVMAKRFPEADILYKDGVHIKYFDEIEEFFELSDWYLAHENERKKIADAGMGRIHKEFNCQKIAQYYLDLAENGTYNAPWT